MIDNIIYKDDNGLVMDIDVSSSGSSTNIVYPDIKGFTVDISITHTGSATNILFPQQLLEHVTLNTERISIS